MAKFPVLRDDSRNQVIPESTSIIEYLQRHYPGPVTLVPGDDAELAAQVRATDRFYDLHVHNSMQQIVGDKLRPADGHDPIGLKEAKERLGIALGIAEEQMATRKWACGDVFSMADCAAGPPLFFINKMMPLSMHLKIILERHTQQPTKKHTKQKAEPFMQYFPG